MLDQPIRKQAIGGSTGPKVPAPGIAPLFNSMNPATACMQFWNKSAVHVGGEVAQSWLHFLGDRWAKDLAFPQQIAACKTADDLYVAYTEFWRQAAKDYSAEFNEIADATWSAVRETFDGVVETCGGENCKGCGGKQASA
jgi:phasin protein